MNKIKMLQHDISESAFSTFVGTKMLGMVKPACPLRFQLAPNLVAAT